MSLAKSIMVRDRAERAVLQDYCPLADSIEWRLGQRYLLQRGSQAFLGDARPVPYVINNDGTLSRHAAEVLLASVAAADGAGALEGDIIVLELGIGVGLFARYFLDAFRDLCELHGTDYYDRLRYVAADRSGAMVRDACRHGIFAQHGGRYQFRVVDALNPARDLLAEDSAGRQGWPPVRAVFLNYLLDCLPAAVLEVGETQDRQLCVRTCLARGVNLAERTDLTAAQLVERAASPDPQHQLELLEVYGLLASEYDYRPVDLSQIPYGEVAASFASTHRGRVLHNYGALQCLERLLDLLRDDGFILLNDYGPTKVSPTDEYEHQRFSDATAIGVNFPLLKSYFGDRKQCQWAEPPGEDESIHARLLSRQPAGETISRFHECFGQAHRDWLQEPVKQARELSRAGRFESAATCYGQALERQPTNWVLMGEAAMFLTFTLRNPKAGADLAKVALGLNPISAELWNTLGDSLFECGRVAEAGAAYRRAVQLGPKDVRARYNLAWVHEREKEYAAALHELAEGLALDWTGEFRERLMRKQEEVLSRLAQRQQQEYLRMANRISQPKKTDGQSKQRWQPERPGEEQTTDSGAARG